MFNVTVLPGMFTATKQPGHPIVSEASTIGLAPGEWPTLISFTDVKGNGYMAHRAGPILHHGEFCGYRYHERHSGAAIDILND